MCTAIQFKTNYSYFGRNLDLEFDYDEKVVITPRNFPFLFSHAESNSHHPGICGIGIVSNGYPLYFDAANEYGLAAAGLNFPENAFYFDFSDGKTNLASFEFIPWLLCNFKSIEECIPALYNVNFVNLSFSSALPPTPLHWMLADKTRAVVVEPVKDGIKIFENPVGVLTNNPPFEFQLPNLNNFSRLSPQNPRNSVWLKTPKNYSNGLGGIGLPGDFSSMSRFVRAAFINCVVDSDFGVYESVCRAFHTLSAVSLPSGCVKVRDKNEITRYSSVCALDTGVYYYTTYENPRITSVDMHKEDLDKSVLISYPLLRNPQILEQN